MVYRSGAQETEVRTFLSQDELGYEMLKLIVFLFSLRRGLWDLSSPTGDGTWTLRMRALTPNQWATGELPTEAAFFRTQTSIVGLWLVLGSL